MLAFCTSPRFAEHQTGPNHPERPDRIRAIALAVREAGLINSPNPFPDFQLDPQLSPIGGEKLLELEPRMAEIDELRLVHSEKYIDRIREVCEMGGGVLDQGDTAVGPESYEIARLSCGSLLTCCDAVVSGKVNRAFSAARPPGHHAEPDRPMGFCLFANVAIAARYLQRRYGVGKIAIVDFDVHHGNGTQAALEEEDSILFISLHQHPKTCYPGSGYEWETGVGPGEGFTLNIPMNPGSGDEEYRTAMHEQVLPALDQFKPEFMLLSAGFDAHRDDPLANINLSEDGFAEITRLLAQSSNKHCRGKIVSALEGGYNLKALGRSVVRHLVELR